MRAAGLLAALTLVAAPAGAEEQAPPQAGHIWRGTLGEAAITACFFERDAREGVYYADAALEPIRLQPMDSTAEEVSREIRSFDEEDGPIWTFAPAADDRLAGEWQQGGQTLPVRLTAVPATAPEYGTPCESEAFLAPLLVGGAITAKPARFGSTAYTELEYTGPKRSGLDDYNVATFALDPIRPGDAAINRALTAAMPDGTAAHVMGECAGWSLGNGGGGLGYLDKFLAPILITPRWLGIRDSGSSYCGGAHPNHFSGLAVYDRDSGAEVDPATWFKPGALEFYDFEGEIEPKPAKRPIAGLLEALAKAVQAHWPARDGNDECGVPEVISGTSWQIGLTRKGPVFVPQFPHVIFACTEEVVVPWKAVRPFLSDEGRAVAKSLR
jgi:hypothetical protein